LRKDENFGDTMLLDCLSVDGSRAQWLQFDEASLQAVLHAASEQCVNVSAISPPSIPKDEKTRKALVFFVPLASASKETTSFGSTLPMTRASVIQLFSLLRLNPAFMQNLLGRPDYWALQGRWYEEDNQFLGCDIWCQHPRWNLHVQGAPLSVYLKYDTQQDLIVYLVSHKPNDMFTGAFRNLLNTLVRHPVQHHINDVLLESPPLEHCE
jgi:hypothetical protein